MLELCPNCDQEWPARFGRHNCNFHKRSIHVNAIVVEPRAELTETLERLTSRLYSETCRSAEFADCAGEEPPYREVLGQIDAAIGKLKRFRSEVQSLAHHAHVWSEDDYCVHCGRDGRA